MAEFNKGFQQDVKRTVTRTINQTVTGLAETALGDINKWREVIAANPAATLPFSLPPSLQSNIDALNNTIAFTGLKIPPVSVLDSDLKKALGDLAKPTIVSLDKQLGTLLGDGQKAIKEIGQIEWFG